MCNERSRDICYTITAYEVHTFKIEKTKIIVHILQFSYVYVTFYPVVLTRFWKWKSVFFKSVLSSHCKNTGPVTRDVNPLSANPTKWSNTLNLPTNCLSVFDHFAKSALKGLSPLKWGTKHFYNSKDYSFISEKVLYFYFSGAKFINVS